MADKKKLDLMIHCGGYRVERGEVKRVETPERTKTWVPIPHDRLLELVERTLEFGGFKVVQEAHALSRDGDRYFGLMQVEPKRGKKDGDSGTVAGVRNSHDKSFPAGLVLGDAPFVCDNLVFSGEVKLARKHTRHVERDLPNLVDRAVGKLLDLRYVAGQRTESYRAAEIDDRDAHHLLIQAVDARVVANSKIPKVLGEWRSPSHEEFAARTVWSFFNAFTSVMKDTNLFSKPRCSDALHGILDSHVGFALGRAA